MNEHLWLTPVVTAGPPSPRSPDGRVFTRFHEVISRWIACNYRDNTGY